MHTKTLQIIGDEPVTVEQAALQCYLLETDDTTEALLTRLISVARAQAENRTWRSFVEKEIEGALNSFPKGYIELPFPRLKEVTQITYGENELSEDRYIVDTHSEPGRIYPVNNWPSASGPNAVKITYTTE